MLSAMMVQAVFRSLVLAALVNSKFEANALDGMDLEVVHIDNIKVFI